MTNRICSISITSPESLRADGRLGSWFGLGISADEMRRLAATDDPQTAGDEAVHRLRSATVVFVAHEGNRTSRVIAWKGLLAMNEIFYTSRADEGWLFTDHFRNALAAVPVGERRMSDDALLQHYTGAATLRRTTYARGVSRLMNGDRLTVDPVVDSVDVQCFSRHASIATDEPLERHLERIDGAFEDVLAPLSRVEDLAIGFSGGVDSTLILSYLGDAGTPVTIKPGSPEFDAETDYARDAAELLGRTIDEVQLEEREYLERLESLIETLGMPISAYASPATETMYTLPFSTFIIGEGADAVFGSGRGIRRVAAGLSGRGGRFVLGMLQHTPGPVGRRARQINGYAELFAEPPSSPNGYAGRTNQYYGGGDLPERMFGDAAIAAMNSRFLHQIDERVELETDEHDRFFRHMEICLWQYIFADRALVGRHAAHARGKVLSEPYLTSRVIDEYLKVPARLRYYRGLTGKWILKELLSRRVPGYRVNKPKLATSLPFNRYYRSGPLATIWDRYDMPAAIPADLRDQIRATPSPTSWMAINHAIWEDRVVANPGLRPHPATVAQTFSIDTSD